MTGKKQMRFFGFIAVIILAGAISFAMVSPDAGQNRSERWVWLDNTSESQTPRVLAADSDRYGMTVKYTLTGFALLPVEIDGRHWEVPTFPGRGYIPVPGTPDVPVVRKMFAIPPIAGLKVKVKSVDYETYENVNVPPLQPFLLETDPDDKYSFVQDEFIYERDEFYPGSWATASIAGIYHGIRLGQIEIHPFSYNPSTKILRVAKSMELYVSFEGYDEKDSLDYDSREIPLHMETPLKNILLNYDFMGYRPSRSKSGVDYLIIADDALAGAQSLLDLASYHQSQGRNVSIVDTTTAGATADAIKTYIQGEYDSGAPPALDYVLLVGDVDVIPFKQDAHLYSDSDIWYGWLDGGDFLADVGVGRFPAADEAQLDIMVSKTLDYHNRTYEGDWMTKSLLVAHGEDYPFKYTECKESIYGHTFYLDPPVFDRLYGAEGATNLDLVGAIEEGRGVINYRGHGDETSWVYWNNDDEYFTTQIVRTLLNGNMTPVIFAIACQNLDMMNSHSETLGEAFLRYDQGAVAFLGAIHTSYTIVNHDFDRSLYYGIWDNGINVIGDLLNWANLDMYNTFVNENPGYESWAQSNITMYLWIGDPAIEIPISGILAPLDLEAQGMSTSEISLTWNDRSDNEGGFIIERRDSPGGPFIQVADLPADTETWDDSGLNECGTYTYRAYAYQGTDTSLYSNESTTQTLGSQPANFSAIGTAIDENTLTWSDVTDGETGFAIYRYSLENSRYELIHTASYNSQSFVDTGLTEGTTYDYKICTLTLGGESAYAGPVSSITLPVQPANPDFSAQPEEFGLSLTWQDESQGEDGYRIYKKAPGDTGFSETGTTLANVETYLDENNSEGAVYQFYVAGFNASGEGPHSEILSTLTLPESPSNLAATTISTSQINLSWDDNSGGELGYSLERDTGGGFEPLAQIHSGGVSFADTGLGESTPTTYRLVAFNSSGDSPEFEEVSAWTMPKAPTNLIASETKSGAIALAWEDNSLTENGYIIESSVDNNDFEQIGQVDANVTLFETSADPDTVFRVYAFNDYIGSEYSNEASVTGETSDDDDASDDDDFQPSDDDDSADTGQDDDSQYPASKDDGDDRDQVCGC